MATNRAFRRTTSKATTRESPSEAITSEAPSPARSKATSKEIAEVLRRLEHDNGRLTAEDVVKEAEPETSPLHSQFEWKDEKAGPQYRLMQARQLIRSIRWRVEVGNLRVPAPVYVRDVTADHRNGYRNLAKIQTEEDTARATVTDSMQRVINAVARAKRLAQVLNVEYMIAQIDDLAQSVIRNVNIDQPPAGNA